MKGIGANNSSNRHAKCPLRRLLVGMIIGVFVTGCVPPSKEYLEEASELGLYQESIGDLLDQEATLSSGDSIDSPDLSGVYVSEITSDHPWYFLRKFSNLILRIKQDGSKITAFDSTYNVKIEGEIRDNLVDYYVFPSTPTSGNAVTGKWAIGAGQDALVGKWQSTSHLAGGTWNLRKLEHNGIELYTTSSGKDHAYNIDRSEELFDTIFSSADDRNIVFYLHGRGRGFEGEFDASGIPYIENFSHTRFVLVRWLSRDDITPRPYKHAVASSLGLADLIFAFDDYKSRKPENVAGKKVTLLAHSMGNIPVKEFLSHLYNKRKLQKGLFDSVILSSADVPFNGHRYWLEKCDFSKQVFVIQHHKDLILYLSGRLFKDSHELDSTRLGRGIDIDDEVLKGKLAANAMYLDLSNFSEIKHKHFISSEARPLFKMLLNGRVPVFPDPGIGLYRKADDEPIYYFYESDPDLISYPDLIHSSPEK